MTLMGRVDRHMHTTCDGIFMSIQKYIYIYIMYMIKGQYRCRCTVAPLKHNGITYYSNPVDWSVARITVTSTAFVLPLFEKSPL